MQNAITIGCSTWNKSASYGRIAVETKDYLEKKGFWVNTVGRESPNRIFHPSLLNFLIGYPTNYHHFGMITQFGRRVGFATFESSEIPDSWIQYLNQCDAVMVPCTWNKTVFEHCGVTKPIRVVPHGISNDFYYVPRPKREIFRFLTIGDRGQRKGFIEAISAFVINFKDREDVELVIKARELRESDQVMNLINPNIRVINEDYTDAQMQSLYASADCMVFAAHGEGFGWPPREFATTGGIALATRFSGLADELDHWGIGLGYDLVPAWPIPPANFENFRGLGQWADVDVEVLADEMLRIYKMPYEERITMGKKFSDFATGHYRWGYHGDALLQMLGLSE